MKIAIEKLRDSNGKLLDVRLLPNPETIFPCDDPEGKYKFVQVWDGKCLQAFTAEEMDMVEVEK